MIVSKHLLGDGKPAGVLRYRHPLHHARGVSATLRRGQAGHERCAQETRHSGRPLQGSKYSTDMILNIILNPSGEHCCVQCRFHPDHLGTPPHNTEPTPHLSTGVKSLITSLLMFYSFQIGAFFMVLGGSYGLSLPLWGYLCDLKVGTHRCIAVKI